MSTRATLQIVAAVLVMMVVYPRQSEAQTSSPFEPPESDLGVFVVNSGGGLDTGCTFRSGGPLIINVPIPAVVNPLRIDGNGNLTNVQQLIKDKVIGAFAVIRFPVFDIDNEAVVTGAAPEIDAVSFNGTFQKNLVGKDGIWTDDSIVVPVSLLKFNQPGQTNVVNKIRIDIDVGNAAAGEEFWCMSVDWASIQVDLAAPYVLAHGINADRTTWEGSSAPGVLATLDAVGVRYDRFSAGKNSRSSTNAGVLNTRIVAFLASVNSKKVHIIAHSKGGLDAQFLQSLKPSFKILSLSTLSTPHMGSVSGDATVIKLEKANTEIKRGTDPNGYVAAFLNSPNAGPQFPGVRDLTTYEASNAISLGLRGNISKTFTIGADADLNSDNELNINEDDELFPGLLHWYADESWLLMRDFSSISIVSITTVPGTFWGTNKTLIYNSVVATTPQANDIVVTVNSANPSYGTSLLMADPANHSTVKNGANIQRILTATIPLK